MTRKQFSLKCCDINLGNKLEKYIILNFAAFSIDMSLYMQQCELKMTLYN